MIKTGTAVNKIEFIDESTYRMRENYNLGGLEVRSISLPWPPYLMLSDCKAETLHCHSEGYLVDFMDMAKAVFNFTYISCKEPNDDWGLAPKASAAAEGPLLNRGANWSGVVGNVIDGNFDLSLGTWHWLRDRAELLSFSPVARTRFAVH